MSSEIISILNILLGRYKSVGSSEVLFFCPWCGHHKQKLAINLATGKWHCWVCDQRGSNLFTLFKKIDAPKQYFQRLAIALNTPIVFQEDTPNDAPMVLPPEYLPLWESSRNLEYRQAIAYLKRRNVTLEIILKYKLGYCQYGKFANRIIIPSFDEYGHLNFFSARAYYDAYMPYLNPVGSKNIVGFESLISWNFPIVICEGPMDAIAIRRNAIPLFGKSLPSALLQKIIIHDVQDVYLALDGDALRNALDIAKYFVEQGVNIYFVDVGQKDPGEIGFAGMMDLLRTANKVTLFDLLRARISLV